MPSSIRNNRKPHRVLPLATSVSLLLLGPAAQASDHNFVFTAYSNGTGGDALLAGNYAAATQALHEHSRLLSTEPATTSNNRCVALSVLKKLDSARVACDEAVRDAQAEKETLPSYQYWARRLENEYLAVALSNRAVLHWMSSDTQAAAADLKKAEALSPQAAFVERNRAALEFAHTAVAQVIVAPAAVAPVTLASGDVTAAVVAQVSP